MSANHFGTLFKVTTFGESHGLMLGCVIEGCPSGFALSEADIQPYLDRRKPGQSRFASQRKESDQVQIVSGVFEGKTLGTPIALLIPNEDAKSKDYEALRGVFRPGHGDYSYWAKYGLYDHRGGGRASARETAARVAAGAIAQQWLKKTYGIRIQAYVSQIGLLKITTVEESFIDQNDLYCPDPNILASMENALQEARKKGDSLGAEVTVVAHEVPAGWGEPVFEKLDAELSKALMSIPAAKAIEIGDGTQVVSAYASQQRDAMTPEGFLSNHAGGILAGISTGQPIVCRVAFKPPSSILSPIPSLNEKGEPVTVQVKGRHDPCVGPRAVPVVEAMVAITLMDMALRQQAFAVMHKTCVQTCG